MHNCFENDGTPDNSPWTSIITDGIPGTSPSVNEGNLANSSDVASSVTSPDQDIEEEVESKIQDLVTCTACNWDAKKKKVTCWNGSEKIPVD